jgi:hypothetical protein
LAGVIMTSRLVSARRLHSVLPKVNACGYSRDHDLLPKGSVCGGFSTPQTASNRYFRVKRRTRTLDDLRLPATVPIRLTRRVAII